VTVRRIQAAVASRLWLLEEMLPWLVQSWRAEPPVLLRRNCKHAIAAGRCREHRVGLRKLRPKERVNSDGQERAAVRFLGLSVDDAAQRARPFREVIGQQPGRTKGVITSRQMRRLTRTGPPSSA
jgi:hypothetical protein